MICLRCGYCCTKLLAIVIKDPEGKPEEPNLMAIGTNGPERCPHLEGDKPGEYKCSVHDKPWYLGTPCDEYQSHWPDQTCRLGKYLISAAEEKQGHSGT